MMIPVVRGLALVAGAKISFDLSRNSDSPTVLTTILPGMGLNLGVGIVLGLQRIPGIDLILPFQYASLELWTGTADSSVAAHSILAGAAIVPEMLREGFEWDDVVLAEHTTLVRQLLVVFGQPFHPDVCLLRPAI